VDTHTEVHRSFSWLLEDLTDEIYENYDLECLPTRYPRAGSKINPLLGFVPNEEGHRTLLVNRGTHTLVDHIMRDVTTVDTGAHRSFSWLLEEWFPMIMGTDSLSSDHRTLLVIVGIDTLCESLHAGHDNGGYSTQDACIP
jgi:hypothetical protein